MSDLRQRDETERLPWLEPYRDGTASRTAPASPVGAAGIAPRRAVSIPFWLLAVIGAIAVAAAGYWIGRRSGGPEASTSVTTELPQATLPYHSLDELADEPEPPPPPPLSEVEKPATVPAPAPTKPASRTATARPSQRTVAKPRPAAKPVARPRAAPKRPAQQAPAKRAEPARPRFVLRTSPPPVAGRPGQVIEIGRYTNPRIADAMWHRVVWRYPYLGRLSKAVTPTSTQRQRVYALRLGTGSRSHARALCRNLVSIGYPCAVV